MIVVFIAQEDWLANHKVLQKVLADKQEATFDIDLNGTWKTIKFNLAVSKVDIVLRVQFLAAFGDIENST